MSYTLKPGDLLVAPPATPDDRFNKTVLFLTDHDVQGSRALCLNRVTDYRVNDLITPLNVQISWDPHLYWGGPVGQDASYMLHSPDWTMDQYTRAISANWSVTQHWSMFVHLSDHDDPQHWRIFAGCAAWAPGQLNREILGQAPWNPRHSWLIVRSPDVNTLLDIEPEHMWVWACDSAAAQAASTWMA